jgi:hypothetical protein
MKPGSPGFLLFDAGLLHMVFHGALQRCVALMHRKHRRLTAL